MLWLTIHASVNPTPVEPQNYIENGREYHGFRAGMYMYPCDEVSGVRMHRHLANLPLDKSVADDS